jgi:peptidylprolyl isomerase
MQLAPGFAPVHVANIRALARGGWWDGAKIYRVQDNYVVQWGNNEGEKPFPPGVVAKPPAEYARPAAGLQLTALNSPDAYATRTGFVEGWPVAVHDKEALANLTHCYGMVGVGRDLSPDTGTGGELYAVIGHAPRHLDRNIAVVGRIVQGIEQMSSLPRGTEALGFYKERTSDVPIVRARIAADLQAAERPRFEYLTGASFGDYLHARKNRQDDFFIRPAGGADICNVNVPVRPVAR